MTIEYRSFTGESVEATDEGHVFGLAIPYNRTTTIGNMDHGGFREQIAPGACSKSIREADIVALNNHNSGQPLGRTSAGNLTLNSTPKGIEPDLVPIDTTYGQDLKKNVKAGIVRGWSFGFEVVKDDWVNEDGEPADEWSGTDRTIREMKLIEVSPVTFPAYDMTSIGTRSALLEAREAKFSDPRGKRAAKASYSDLETCGECGSGKQYGSYCTDCGEPMSTQAASYKFCPACGSELDGSRSAHVCETRGGNAPGDGSKPYGNVTYGDPGYQEDGKKRYPLDTKAHAKAAWSYINQADNASAYNSEQLASIKAKIKSALKKFGVNVSDDDQKSAELAEEWRKKAEARKAAKRAKKERDAAEAAATCPQCGGEMSCRKCSSLPKPGDPNVFGANHGIDGDVTESYSAEPGDETRGDKGKSNGLSGSTQKRIPQISSALNQALKLFASADIDSLPPDVQQAIALVSSASTHAGHLMNHEGLTPADSISDSDADGRTAEPKPGETTSAETPDETALPTDDEIRSAIAAMRSREVELGL